MVAAESGGVVFFAFIFGLGKLSGEEKKRVAVIVVLFAFAAIFWSAFEQAPTALNLFARDFTQRTVGGFQILDDFAGLSHCAKRADESLWIRSGES